MRDYWELPKENDLKRTGTDWLLILLNNTRKDMHQNLLLLFWRAWHLRDDAIHAKGQATIVQSANFLRSYTQILNSNTIPSFTAIVTDAKGKKKIDEFITSDPATEVNKIKKQAGWEPPPPGWLKVNTDGSFIQSLNAGYTGVVIRDHQGLIIAATGKLMNKCNDAKEAEAAAIVEGAKLAKELNGKNCIFETDCAEVIKDIKAGPCSLSTLRSYFTDFHDLTKVFTCWNCNFVSRAYNSVAHACAAYSKWVSVMSGTIIAQTRSPRLLP